ncbi:MAG: alpha/beta hydrolase-fold protein [Ignavibacteriales bacterium]|nr:alpha/beta hydrolase-fold protein [Ignavibacteriales bacterium]
MKSTHIILLAATLLVSSLASAQSSRTELRSLSVPGVGSWDFNVYLPPGYDQSTERYPVVYLFRGAVDEWLDRTEDASRNGRNIQSITDTLIAQNKMGGVILVMPGFTAMTGAATEADYSFILNTLIPYVDQRYRTLPTRWHRGVDGFSLGGLHMVNLIWKNPERFASAGSYDGTLSLFNFNQMIAAGDRYFARLRPMQFLLHSVAVPPSNLTTNRQFESLLNSYGIHNTFDDLIFSTSSQHNWWYADEHMIRALPLHWSKFQNPPHNVPLRWTSALAAKVAGTVHLAWSIGAITDSIKSILDYSKDNGATWQTLSPTFLRDSTFDWNALLVPDGTRYLLRVRAFGDTSYGIVQSAQRFTVDNPGNGAPDISLLFPQKEEIVSGTYAVRWFAEDPEGAPLRNSIYASSDNGASWQLIAADLPNSGSYNWNSRLSPNSSSFLLKLTSFDGSLTSETVSQRFEVRNIREPVGNIRHAAGPGDGRVVVNTVDPLQLTGHSYRMTIDDTGSTKKRYSIFDVTKSSYALQNIPVEGNGSEGPLFDGLRISIFDYSEPLNNRDSTRWTKGISTLSSQVSIPTIYIGTDTVKGIAYPSDYEFRVAGHIVDTASTFLGAPPTPLFYSVWNTTENRQVDVVANEIDGDGRISRFDEIYVLEKDRRGQTTLTWVVFFSGDDNARLPSPGDVFTLKTFKPLRSTDVFEFSTTVTSVADDKHISPDRFELGQNYPNPFNPSTQIRYSIASEGHVSVRVYDLLGKEVAVITDNEPQLKGWHTASWNGRDISGTAVSSGVYFCRVRAGADVQTIRLLLLK